MSGKFGIDLVAQAAADYAASCVYAQADSIGRVHPDWTPIEVLFFLAFYHIADTTGFTDWPHGISPSMTMEAAQARADHLEYFEILLVPQCVVANWRVDFAIAMGREHMGHPKWLIVECDGHDFHEKTKEQAARDKARDRDLVARGFQVFHFTGSELYRGPIKCVEEVVGHMIGIPR